MNQPQKRVDMRAQMPETAKWVDAKRQEYGAAHVNDCLKRGLDGQPGYFYAMERGHIVGTPFPSAHPMDEWQRNAVTLGCSFAIFMREPSVQTPAPGGAA